MKFQNILLPVVLAYQSTNALAIFKNNSENKIFKYNFYCVEDNHNLCSKFNKNLVNATNSLSNVLDSLSPVNFEVFVDDVSKYRVDTSKDALAFVLDTNFAPLNPKNSNTISPYPNANTLTEKLKETEDVKNSEFILLLNNFKSDDGYLKELQDDDQTNLIITEISEALLRLNKLSYSYSEDELYTNEDIRNYVIEVLQYYKCIDINKNNDMKYIASSYNACKVDISKSSLKILNLRKNETAINENGVEVQNECQKLIDITKIAETIHWKDKLISKGKEHFPLDKYEYKRIVALGDIHGDYEKLKSLLRHAKLIDKNDDWIGTDSILVQVGDLADRGSDFKNIMDLFIKIRNQAKEKGGIVYMLLGNHELNNLQGNYSYTTKKDFDSFGGYMAREKALSMEEEYGKLLRKEMNITMNIDGNLFIHAGLPYEFAKMGIDEINNHAHEIFSTAPSFDELLNDYYNQNKTHPLYTDPLFDQINGPLWTRYFIVFPDDVVCEELNKVLEVTKAKRMILGHNIQEYGKITTKCDNKLIFIDIALSDAIGNYFGYLEILNDKKEIWTRYH